MLVENPTTPTCDRGDSGQPPTDPNGAKFRTSLVHSRVPAIPHSYNIADAYGVGEVSIADASSHQLLFLGHSAHAVHDLRKQCHAGIVRSRELLAAWRPL
jgi:hypothetical protein